MDEAPQQQPAGWLLRAWHWRWTHHIVGLVLVGFAWLGFHRWGTAHLPPGRLMIGNLVYGGFLAAWAVAYIVHRRREARGMDSDLAWSAYTTQVLWICNPPTVFNFWLQAPYADASRRVVSLLVCSALVAACTVVTVRPPSLGKRNFAQTALPLFIPLGVMAYFLTWPGEQAFPVVPLLALYGVMMLALREFIQDEANAAHARYLAAEAARLQAQSDKERFLAAASHDLDQPLQSARLSFDLALAAPDGARREAAARRVEWAFDAMEDMVRQVTQHLQLDAGAAAARREPVELTASLARAIEANEHRAGLAGVELRTLPTSLAVLGDSTMIERTLGNFIANALRHAHASRVLTGARRVRGDGGDRVRIWVIDNGRGVPAEARERLFEDFYQAPGEVGEVRGGFGLGLGSARKMAELMGGSAGLDPCWLGGKAFFLELPAA